MFSSNGFDTIHVVCTDLLCVVCIGLLCAEFSTVSTGLGRPMFWKLLCLLSTPEDRGYHRLSTYIDYLRRLKSDKKIQNLEVKKSALL